jgi:hypothetical protein
MDMFVTATQRILNPPKENEMREEYGQQAKRAELGPIRKASEVQMCLDGLEKSIAAIEESNNELLSRLEQAGFFIHIPETKGNDPSTERGAGSPFGMRISSAAYRCESIASSIRYAIGILAV